MTLSGLQMIKDIVNIETSMKIFVLKLLGVGK